MKLVRRLASEITQRGAAIYDALGDEKRLRVERARAVGRDVDLDEIEAQVQEQIASVRDNVQGLERTLGDLRRDEESLESKIEKRRAELERAEQPDAERAHRGARIEHARAQRLARGPRHQRHRRRVGDEV